MATAEERRAAAREARKAAETPSSSERVASELEVGMKIFFPNSRKAQEIEQIVDDDAGADTPVRKVIAGDAQWSLRADTMVRVQA